MDSNSIELSNAQLIRETPGDEASVLCKGSLQRQIDNDIELEKYLLETEYIGVKFTIEELQGHNYLSFNGRKVSEHGQPTVYVYDEHNKKIAELTRNYGYIDDQWHNYVVELPNTSGEITVILNGGYIDCSGSNESTYMFSDIVLY